MLSSTFTLQESSVQKIGCVFMPVSYKNSRRFCLQIQEFPTNLERSQDTRKGIKSQVKKLTTLPLGNVQSFFSRHFCISFRNKNLHIKGQILYLLSSMAGCPLISVNTESCPRFPQLRMA